MSDTAKFFKKLIKAEKLAQEANKEFKKRTKVKASEVDWDKYLSEVAKAQGAKRRKF